MSTTTAFELNPPVRRNFTRQEIVRWFRKFRFDSEFQVTTKWAAGSHCVPIKCLCEFIGVPRAYVYQILRGDAPLSNYYQERLSYGIHAVISGLRWTRVKQRWVMVNPTKFGSMPRFDRLSREHRVA